MAVRTRDANKLATTTITNELANAVNSLGQVLVHGYGDKPLIQYTFPTVVYVTVTKDGGSAGDSSTNCNFTYKFTPPGGASDGSDDITGQTPAWSFRLAKVTYTQAQNGTIQWEDQGDGTFNWTLYEVDEVPSDQACT